MRSSLVLSLLASLAAGCGGLPETRPEPGESEALDARQWHAEVVRIEGALSVHPEEEDPRCCTLATRACELTERICETSRRDELDEGTRVLCEDSEPRCTASQERARTLCGCGS